MPRALDNVIRLVADGQLSNNPMVTAQICVGFIVHYLLIQELLHGSEILSLERDRIVDGLIRLITAHRPPEKLSRKKNPGR